ncbi:MAG: hypothetical protein IPH20_11035 [Bacteroidales bacterium]|nr:hypothetical protein [Bacteroidales bacterium]
MKKTLLYIIATVLAAFGLLTLFLSSSVILDLFGIRGREGNYVLFIVWANFLSSILYLIAAYGFIKGKRWTIKPLGLASIVLLVAFTGLLIHVNAGGIYETKTIGAMAFRITITIVFAAFAFLMISKNIK